MAKPRHKRLEKAAQKEIREGQALFVPNEKPAVKEKLSAKELLIQYPKKVAEKLMGFIGAAESSHRHKKHKKKPNLSKRTNPGEVESNSTPHIVHVEGGRWKKTVERQNLMQAKGLDKRIARGKKR